MPGAISTKHSTHELWILDQKTVGLKMRKH